MEKEREKEKKGYKNIRNEMDELKKTVIELKSKLQG